MSFKSVSSSAKHHWPWSLFDPNVADLSALNAKLQLAAHQWRATVDAIEDALVLIDPKDTILRMNRAAAESTGGSWSLWVGQPSARLAEHQPWGDALQLVRDARARDAIVTGRSHHAESGKTWELWARPLLDPANSAVLVIARDVTAFLALQESVRHAETMAALGTLTVGFAHEVRNPLFAISSLVDAWAQCPAHDPAPFVDGLRRQVKRLQTLMVELLEFGKPSGSVVEPCLLSQSVLDAVRACHTESLARNVQVTTSVLVDGEVSVTRRLERVFVNLILNAIQHSPPGEDVTVEIGPAPGAESALQVVVRDHGPGIPPEDLPRLFAPFFSRRPGGFGLGLAISQRIVEDHHGRITAANDPMGGAVMTVIIPFSGRPEKAGRSRKAHPSC